MLALAGKQLESHATSDVSSVRLFLARVYSSVLLSRFTCQVPPASRGVCAPRPRLPPPPPPPHHHHLHTPVALVVVDYPLLCPVLPIHGAGCPIALYGELCIIVALQRRNLPLPCRACEILFGDTRFITLCFGPRGFCSIHCRSLRPLTRRPLTQNLIFQGVIFK